ncbi:hypothetical protein CMU51_11475 [Elizabethkingia anophelis]|uniref:Uncharacterized protein n=1 Tax=Elizabethkingia anophelis TaxID=1117645 RepID=A0AAE4T6K9_9FLAO|nr:hypothetical protein [Elizabethkingia anophelis]
MVWQFFESFYNQGNLLFSKGFGALRIFYNRVLPTFANWQIWVKKKAVRFRYCFKFIVLI